MKTTLLASGIKTIEEAKMIMNFLYFESLGRIEILESDSKNIPVIAVWYAKKSDENYIAKWTAEYGNIMVDKCFVNRK